GAQAADPRPLARRRIPALRRQAVWPLRRDLAPPGGERRAAGAAGHVRRADHRRGAPPAAPLAPGAACERAPPAASAERRTDAIRLTAAGGHRGAARDFQAALKKPWTFGRTPPRPPDLARAAGEVRSRAGRGPWRCP